MAVISQNMFCSKRYVQRPERNPPMEKHEIKAAFLADELSYMQAIEKLEEDCGYSSRVAEDIVSNWYDEIENSLPK